MRHQTTLSYSGGVVCLRGKSKLTRIRLWKGLQAYIVFAIYRMIFGANIAQISLCSANIAIYRDVCLQKLTQISIFHIAIYTIVLTYLTIDRPDSALRKLYSLCNTRELEKRLKAVHLRLDPVLLRVPLRLAVGVAYYLQVQRFDLCLVFSTM